MKTTRYSLLILMFFEVPTVIQTTKLAKLRQVFCSNSTGVKYPKAE